MRNVQCQGRCLWETLLFALVVPRCNRWSLDSKNIMYYFATVNILGVITPNENAPEKFRVIHWPMQHKTNVRTPSLISDNGKVYNCKNFQIILLCLAGFDG